MESVMKWLKAWISAFVALRASRLEMAYKRLGIAIIFALSLGGGQSFAQSAESRNNIAIWQGVEIQRNGWLTIGGNGQDWLLYKLPVIAGSDENRKIWERIEFSSYGLDNQNFLSIAMLNEFNCSKNLNHIIRTISYDKNNLAGGVVVAESDILDWQSVPPNSYNAVLAKIVCSTPPSEVVEQNSKQISKMKLEPHQAYSKKALCSEWRTIQNNPRQVADACDGEIRSIAKCDIYKIVSETLFAAYHDRNSAEFSSVGTNPNSYVQNILKDHSSTRAYALNDPVFSNSLIRVPAAARASKAENATVFGVYAKKRCLAGNPF